jgi:Protein of unknown function (DUF3467)
MSDNQPPDQSQMIQMVGFARSPDFRYLFANNARLRVAPGEITLIFTYNDEPPPGQTMTELTSVSLSPTHAKRLSVMLAEMLRAYEIKFGAIPPEPSSGVDGNDVLRRVELILKGEDPD